MATMCDRSKEQGIYDRKLIKTTGRKLQVTCPRGNSGITNKIMLNNDNKVKVSCSPSFNGSN